MNGTDTAAVSEPANPPDLPPPAEGSAASPPGPLQLALEQFLNTLPTKAQAVRHLDGKLSLKLNLPPMIMASLTPLLVKFSDLTVESADKARVKARVLIVEDDPLCRMALKNILKKIPGLELFEANNGRDAVKLLETIPCPNLCISDFSMPEMDGLQFLQALRASPRFKTLDFILCTTSTERFVIQRAAELHVSQYIVKPFAAPKIIEQIERVLAQAAADRESRLQQITGDLGMDGPAFVELVNSFSSELVQTITFVRSSLAMEQWNNAYVRLNALQSACSYVKAASLNAPIRKILRAIKDYDLCASLDGLEELAVCGRQFKQESDIMLEDLGFTTPASPAARAEAPADLAPV